MLLVVSFFVGLLWYDFCDIANTTEENFITLNNISHHTSDTYDLTILLTYFSFTTLSTVGFGDLHPVSDEERVISAFLLLFGVAMTSYVMENLTRMIATLTNLTADFEENDKLSLFIGTLERFNEGFKLDNEFQQSLLSYFEFRWQQNKNLAISTQEDVDLLVQLPQKVQSQIFTNFLFSDF